MRDTCSSERTRATIVELPPRRYLGAKYLSTKRVALPLSVLLLCLCFLVSGCAGSGNDSSRESADGSAQEGSQEENEGPLTVSFIDVGQGDAVLVETGDESYLLDSGTPGQGDNVVEYLQERSVDKLEGIVVSNPDFDHVGGFEDVLLAFDVEEVYVSGDDKSTDTFNDFLKAVQAEGSQVIEARAGLELSWGGSEAVVIAPPTDSEGGLFSEVNDNSVAVLITHQGRRVLLAGDAEKREERYMSDSPYAGPVDVLKVTHHGSDTSSTEEFLQAFEPDIAVIQVGEGNRYGHPKAGALSRLEAAGAEVYRNDHDGDVVIEVEEGEVEVAAER